MTARGLLWRYTTIMGVNGWLFCCIYVCIRTSVTSEVEFDGNSLTYNPQGRVLQMEYAMLAASKPQGCSAVGLAGRRCAVIAARKQLSYDGSEDSRSYCPQMLWDVDKHITLASAGLRSDVQYVADLSRRICMEHMYVWDAPIPCHVLAIRIAEAIHDCTRSDSKRPLAADVILAGLSIDGGPIIFHINPSGAIYPMRACAVGAHADKMMEPLVKWATLSVDNTHESEYEEENTILSLRALVALAHIATENKQQGPDFSILRSQELQIRILRENGGGRLLSEEEVDTLIEKARHDYIEKESSSTTSEINPTNGA